MKGRQTQVAELAEAVSGEKSCHLFGHLQIDLMEPSPIPIAIVWNDEEGTRLAVTTHSHCWA